MKEYKRFWPAVRAGRRMRKKFDHVWGFRVVHHPTKFNLYAVKIFYIERDGRHSEAYLGK